MIVSVKKLPLSVTVEDLKGLFDRYGATRIDLKENPKEGSRFAYIEIPDEKKAFEAVKRFDGFELKGKAIKVKIKEEQGQSPDVPVSKPKNDPPSKVNVQKKEVYPYGFYARRSAKKPLSQFHDVLLPDHYDIAFEITWETLTPTALNPILDENVPPCFPPNEKDEYTGYNRRWLTIDGHLAISPFTVKSAIANGFASIMGGCYRVNNIEEGHKENVTKGQYLYAGKYKRYRVAMDGSSKPGIVTAIDELPDGDRQITIMPVDEYYLDGNLPENLKNLKSGDKVYAGGIQKRGYKPPIIGKLDVKPFNGSIELKYHGPYFYKKDSIPHPRHKHRFYKESGQPIKGKIPAINFLSKNDLKRHVSIGGADPSNTQKEWYQDLNDIRAGSFVYFEAFNGSVTNIGKNFLFKALFNHEDTVPDGSSECIDLTGALCPRCRMFGMTDKTEKNLESIGFKGRFKSSALINDLVIEKDENPFVLTIREEKEENGKKRTETLKIPLHSWVAKDTKDFIASQEFLPISGPPKPNRRDIDGYYNKTTGELKGAKYYLHGSLDSARNIHNVDTDPNYTHRLRNYAQVAVPHLRFTGVIGAENCNLEEIATFIMLLHSDYSGHGFKIGLGKAFGMGSVKSYINRIYIRNRDGYETWHIINNQNEKEESLIASLDARIKDFAATYRRFKNILTKTSNMINKLEGMEQRLLKYPKEGLSYWKEAFKR